MEGFRDSGRVQTFARKVSRVLLFAGLALASGAALAQTFATPGQNTNLVGITPNLSNIPDFQLKQQQEPSCIFRPGNKSAILCAFNDMRASDIDFVQGDSWMGLGMSIDEGETWLSRLAPGFKGDGSRSINKGFAADPSLVAIPGNSPGLAGLTYIAANRPTGGATSPTDSVLVFQRLVEFPREDEDFWKAEDQVRIVATGLQDGGFIDKPISLYKVDRPDVQGSITQSIDVEDETSNIQITTATGTILIVYTVFPEDRTGSKLLARRSFDNGLTWTAATVLADSLTDVTGASIAELGDSFVIAYRQAGGSIPGDEDNCQVNQSDDCTAIDVPDAIMSVVCTNDATMSCTNGTEVMQVCPFDQPASGATFRSFTFPWLAYDGTRVWAFTADRRYAGDASCTPVTGAPGLYTGKPRIVAKSTTNGTNWVGSRRDSAEPIVIAPRSTGFQVMPVATGAKGEVYVAWTDTTIEEEQGLPAGNNGILINDYSNAGARVFRKADVWMTRLNGSSCSDRPNRGCSPTIEDPVRVSSYLTAMSKFQADVKQEIEADLKNLRTHSSGSLAFTGDYKAMAVMPLRQIADDSWIPNALPEGALGPERPGFTDREDVFVAWGDNRDVDANFVIDPEGAEQLYYTPPLNSPANAGGPVEKLEDLDPEQIRLPPALEAGMMVADGVADDDTALPTDTPFTCSIAGDFSRSRDVNVYGSLVREVPSLVAPTPFKPLGTIQRMYPLEFTNIYTDAPLDICLQVANQPSDYPANGLASFYQLPAVGPFAPGDQVELLEATVPAGSSVSRSVFVSTGDANTAITVNAYEGACPATPAGTFGNFINSVEVGSGPLAESAYCEETGTCDLVAFNETHDITLAGPVLEAPVYEAPSYEAPSFEAPVLEAPVLEAPSFEAPSYEAPVLEAPVLEAPSYEAPSYEAPVLEAPVLEAPSLEAPSLEAGALGDPTMLAQGDIVYQDITYVVSPAGNVTTTFSADVSLNGLDTNEIIVQLIAWTNNIYSSTSQCLAVPTSNQQIIAYTELDAESLSAVTLPQTISQAEQNPYVGDITFTAWPDKDIGVTVRIFATGTAATTLATLQAEREACAADPDCDANSGEYGAQRLISFGASAHQCSFTDAVINTNAPPGTIEDCLNNGNEKIQPDSQSPIITTPGNLTVEATSSAGATVDFAVTATDNVDPDPTVTCVPASGSTFPLGGANTVSCEAVDFKGNASVATFTITVEDTTEPEFPATIPDVTASATSSAGADVTYTLPTATDLVDASPAVTCTPASGSTFALGTTSVSCTASDSATPPNTVTLDNAFDVIVTDDIAPEFDSPGAILDVTVEADATDSGVVGAFVSYTLPTASDNVDTSPTVTCTPASGSFFALGLPTPVSCTASDSATPPNTVTLNTAFSVIVQDTTPPALSLPTTATVLPRPGSGDAPSDVSIVGDTFTVEANLPPAEGDGAQVTFIVTALDFVSGPRPATCSPASGSTFDVDTTTLVTCSATDADVDGNTTSGSFFIAVQDTLGPTFDVVDGTTFTIVADSPDGAIVDLVGSGDVVAKDRGVEIATTCEAVPNPNEPPVDPIPLPAPLLPGSYDVTCTAGDSSTTVSVDVNVAIEDNEAPSITIPAGTVEVDADSDGTATVDLLGTIFDTDGDGTPDAAITATDNVDADPTISCVRTDGTGSYDPLSPNVFGAGTHDISCTATDDPDSTGESNTSAAGTFTLVVNDPFPYGINLIVPDKGAKAGATLPIDWVYTVSPDSDVPIDSGFITPTVRWFGPFARQDTECADTASLIEIGDDAGSSDKRYSASNQQWQFSWKTLDAWKGANILLVIEPPGAGVADATRCVNFK